MTVDSETSNSFIATLRAAPGGERVIERLSASRYDQFVDMIHADIDDIVLRMERNRNRYVDLSEDDVTFHIAAMLECLGYTVSNGAQLAGSVDLTVQRVSKNWLWTSEAKIFTALDKVNEGMLQLTTRYSPGDIEHARAGMLIYIKTTKAAKKMADWKNHLLAHPDGAFAIDPCAARPNMAFHSTHEHDGTGLPMRIRHMGVWLHFKPLDSSGRTAKKYKQRS